MRIVDEVSSRLRHEWISGEVWTRQHQIPFLTKPSFAIVYVYRLDGTIRWLQRGGWLEGNLVCVAERLFGLRRRYVQIPKPQATRGRTRFRFSLDEQAWGDVKTDLNALLATLARTSSGPQDEP